MYCNQELLSVLDLYLLTIRNRSQFAFHGSVAACLNVLFMHCLWVERTLSNSRLQTYRILHDNLSKIWNTFFALDLGESKLGKNVQIGRKAPTGSKEKASEWGQKCPKWKKSPNWKQRGSKRVGGKCPNGKKIPNRALVNKFWTRNIKK